MCVSTCFKDKQNKKELGGRKSWDTWSFFTLGPVQTWCPRPGTKMDVVQTHQCPEQKNVHEQLGKGIDYLEIGDKFGVGSSSAGIKESEYSEH